MTQLISPYLYAGLDEACMNGFNFRMRYNMSGIENAMSLITDMVFSYLEVPFEHQKSEYRGREAVEARQIAMYLILVKTGLGLKTVGKFFHRDHSTVIYARDNVSNLMFSDKQFKNKVDTLHKMTLV